jgi:murein DD-endopeptidase MepM/ murein hydrolase activator NlpD
MAPVDDGSRPLGLADLKSGDMVAAFIDSRPAPGPGEYWLIHPRWRSDRVDPAQREGAKPPEPDKVSMEKVKLPMVFPVAAAVRWTDTFLSARDGGARRHLGQDLLGSKLLPLVATFDGTVTLKPGGPGGHYYLSVTRADGWRSAYLHVNNDTPGTDDGNGGDFFAYAPGLKNGSKVVAGEFIAWMGDSGNAESTTPHCHFELWTPEGAVVNATPSLSAAEKRTVPYVRRLYPDLKLKSGEERLDGFISQVAGTEFEVYGLGIKGTTLTPLRTKFGIPPGTPMTASKIGQRVAVIAKSGQVVRVLFEPSRLR